MAVRDGPPFNFLPGCRYCDDSDHRRKRLGTLLL